MPAYASFGEARSPQARAQAAQAAKSAGFRAVKIRIDRTEPGTSLQAVRATRAAVGDDLEIMADLNQWWRMPGDTSPALDLSRVRRIAAELAPAPTSPKPVHSPAHSPHRPHLNIGASRRSPGS